MRIKLTWRHDKIKVTARKDRDRSRNESTAVKSARSGVGINKFANFVLAGQNGVKNTGWKSFKRGVGWSKKGFRAVCNNTEKVTQHAFHKNASLLK